jgi:hypothetical protein
VSPRARDAGDDRSHGDDLATRDDRQEATP